MAATKKTELLSVPQEVIPPLQKTFVSKVEGLTKEGIEIVNAYADLSEKMLSFASSFRSLTDEARQLDRADDGVHGEYLRSQLTQAIGTQNPSIWSRWNTIGEYSQALLPYVDALPPQRDSLYELALAAKEQMPISDWVAEQKITAESSVREVRALRAPAGRQAKKKSHRNRHLNAEITLCFSSYTEAAQVLARLFITNSEFDVKSQKAFNDALKEELGDDFDTIKNRIR